MTDILIINPNSTASMTKDIKRSAYLVARPDTNITALNPDVGPKSIQGRKDGEACLPGLFALFDKETSERNYDAVIIACFDDTGLDVLKRKSPIPVIGIGEAAFHTATLLGQNFSTVTTLSVSIPVIEENIKRYGFANRSVRVRASEVPVLEVGEGTANRIGTEAQAAIIEDKCDSIVLGCAGMANLAERLSNDLGKPVIDGVAAAVVLCEALASLTVPQRVA